MSYDHTTQRVITKLASIEDSDQGLVWMLECTSHGHGPVPLVCVAKAWVAKNQTGISWQTDNYPMSLRVANSVLAGVRFFEESFREQHHET